MNILSNIAMYWCVSNGRTSNSFNAALNIRYLYLLYRDGYTIQSDIFILLKES